MNIGKVAINKTEADNAADAGALAAASMMAGVFNGLAQGSQGMLDNYVAFYGGQFDPAYQFAVQAWGRALYYTATAETLLTLAMIYIANMTPRIWSGWAFVDCFINFTLMGSASIAVYKAMEEVMVYQKYVQDMMQYLDDFHALQLSDYRAMRASADAGHAAAIKTGYQFAFANSNISGKLPEGEEQDKYDRFIDNEEYTSGLYDWDDLAGGRHLVSVQVSVPAVVDYYLQHTKEDYPTVKDWLEKANKQAGIIWNLLLTAGIDFGVISLGWFGLALWEIALIACWASCGATLGISCGVCVGMAQLASSWSFSLWEFTIGWYVIIQGLILVAGATTLYFLKDELDDAFQGCDVDPASRFHNSNPADPELEKLLIVKVEDVPITGNVGVSVTQQHPAAGAGLLPPSTPRVQSSAVALYTGGYVGAMAEGAKYYSRLGW